MYSTGSALETTDIDITPWWPLKRMQVKRTSTLASLISCRYLSHSEMTGFLKNDEILSWIFHPETPQTHCILEFSLFLLWRLKRLKYWPAAKVALTLKSPWVFRLQTWCKTANKRMNSEIFFSWLSKRCLQQFVQCKWRLILADGGSSHLHSNCCWQSAANVEKLRSMFCVAHVWSARLFTWLLSLIHSLLMTKNELKGSNTCPKTCHKMTLWCRLKQVKVKQSLHAPVCRCH